MTFKNNNARITLGLQILRANQQIINLFSPANQGASGSREQDSQFKRLIEWMDGQLSAYRPYMKLQIVNAINGSYIEMDYLKARMLIQKKINRVQEINEKRTGAEYYSTFYAYNLWAQLLASCYDQLQLSPEEAFKETAEEGLSAYGITQPSKED